MRQIEQLIRMKDDINQTICERRLAFEANDNERKLAAYDHREPKYAFAVYPSPWPNKETGEIEWRYHILVYEKDFNLQVDYLKQLQYDIQDIIDKFNQKIIDKKELNRKLQVLRQRYDDMDAEPTFANSTAKREFV
jgi:hypothetical protein